MTDSVDRQFGQILRWGAQASVPVFVLTIIFSGVIYNRNLWAVPDQSFLHIFAWQFLAWMPWGALFPVIRKHLRSHKHAIWKWAVGGFLVAFATTSWFILVSQFTSPYLDQPLTMFGLYKWWLVFWFPLNLFLFWGIIGFCLLTDIEGSLQIERSDDHQRLAIWHGGGQIIINKEDIVWIGSQDYYACIVLKEGSKHWIRTRLKQLLGELPGDWFVHVHRSAILNLRHLEKVDRHDDGYWEAVMSNGERIRVSRGGKAKLEQAVRIIK